MRTGRMKRSENPSARTIKRAFAVLLALTALSMGFASAAPGFTDQAAVPKTPATTQKSTQHSRKQTVAADRRSGAAKRSPAAPAAEQAAPLLPLWPANDHSVPANVVWNSQGLRIDAANSSLHQILKDVSTATGATVSGLGPDQRIFGKYGPGPAREVLSELLDGSGYNVLMIGDQGQGTPRQIVLTRQPSGPAPPQSSNNPNQNSEEGNNADVEEPPPPQPEPQQPQPQQPQPQQPQNLPPGFVPGAQPRTPQQILQEMQQRQQQIEQQQQQQRTNPQ
jgi:hypothetical protein